MKYALPILTGAALKLAGGPKLGIDTYLDYSLSPILSVGTVEQTAAGAQVALTGVSFTSGSTTITHASSTGFAAGAVVTGTGIPDGATVLTKTDATHFELSANTTAAVVSGGTLAIDLPGTATLELDGTYAAPSTGGYDLAMVLRTGNANTLQALRLKFAIIDSAGSAGFAWGKVRPPGYAQQTFDAPKGVAVDLTVVSDPTLGIRSITSLVSIFGGEDGIELALWKLPEATSWVLIKAPVQKNFMPGSPGSVPIWDRYNIDVTKKGRGSQPSLTISAKHSTAMQGLARLNDQQVCVRFTTVDNNKKTASVEVCGEVFLDLEVPRGEANEEQIITGKASFSQLAVFV